MQNNRQQAIFPEKAHLFQEMIQRHIECRITDIPPHFDSLPSD